MNQRDMYYSDKIEALRDVFGADEIKLQAGSLTVDGRFYPIVDDVIILLDSKQYPRNLRVKLGLKVQSVQEEESEGFAEDIQFTFGKEWSEYSEILPEHKEEFGQYFDLVNLADLKDARVCDMGCGIGRWSFFLKDKCRELVLVDFSEAIFVARRNLRESDSAIFFMADLTRLPFRKNFTDFLFCLGVLHHLPSSPLDETRRLSDFSPKILVYLYYALDNRAVYFRWILRVATRLRLLVAEIRSPIFRSLFTWAATFILYYPLILFGVLLKPVGLARYIPLCEYYAGKSMRRVHQDVYDRFFTRIEERVSRKQIMGLQDENYAVVISDGLPYWHFVRFRSTRLPPS